MMGPDYTHWHGTYEIAKHWYMKYVPELEKLIDKGAAIEIISESDFIKLLG